MNIQEFESRLKTENNLLCYLHLLKKEIKRYVIIIAVADTGSASYFTSECAQAMLGLGLKINMLQRYLQPYIGIIEQGNVVYEKCSEDLEQPLWVEGKMNKHDIAVYSAGFKWQHGIGSGAIALIDGANYFVNGRGFNFLVYDPKNDDIIDSCVFNTYDGGGCVHAVNQISRALLSFADKYKDIQMCFISFPQRPAPYSLDLTPFEQLLINDDPKSKLLDWVDDKEKMYSVWNEKYVPYCYDYKSAEEFYEAFQTPNSFFSLDGYRRYEDFASNAVNTRNGVRITVNQPRDFKRGIFFVGNCRFYGWGSTDENTPASLLQKKLNLHSKEQGIIVHNYSYVGADRYIDLLATLRSLPLRKGDIVFFQDRFFLLKDCIAPWRIPYCDLRYNSARPNKYGEIFMDRDFHTSSNGNHMIADGIFDFLKKIIFLLIIFLLMWERLFV